MKVIFAPDANMPSHIVHSYKIWFESSYLDISKPYEVVVEATDYYYIDLEKVGYRKVMVERGLYKPYVAEFNIDNFM